MTDWIYQMTLICYMKYIEDFDLYDKIWIEVYGKLWQLQRRIQNPFKHLRESFL